MNAKYFIFFLLMTLTVSCGKDGSSASPTLVVTGSNQSTALTSYLVPTGSPTSIKMTFHALAVSENADCSNPEVIFDIQGSPVEVEMVGNNTLFSGLPPAGTYQCVIMRISDTIKFKVDSTAVGAFPECINTTTEHTQDIYRAAQADSNLWIDLDGVAITASGSHASPATDIVDIFATNGTPTGTHLNQRISLSGSLVVPGAAVFYADFAGGINGDGTYCHLEDGGFGFR